MHPIPEDWSDRVPKNISVFRQVRCFREHFHAGLTAAGFRCVSGRGQVDAKTPVREMMDMCLYLRMRGGVLQTVKCSLSMIDDTEDKLCPYSPIGGAIQVQLTTPADPMALQEPLHVYLMGISQQFFTGFRFPGMEKSFSSSFLNLYVDDFPMAMGLEKELFFEQTLPAMDAIASVEACAAWWQEKLERWPQAHHWYCGLAMWAQLAAGDWDAAERCADRAFWYAPERHEGLRDMIARQDAPQLASLLAENRRVFEARLAVHAPELHLN